ncbi:MAG: hypothetical protein L0G36_07315, partial [Brevibacterium sp.]|nr:hypothetical protein [Brevibacterium sp.]
MSQFPYVISEIFRPLFPRYLCSMDPAYCWPGGVDTPRRSIVESKAADDLAEVAVGGAFSARCPRRVFANPAESP